MKRIFECVIGENHISFPTTVPWSPSSHGFLIRKVIFEQEFPEKKSSICCPKIWDAIKDHKTVFIYDDTTKTLTKQENI